MIPKESIVLTVENKSALQDMEFPEDKVLLNYQYE